MTALIAALILVAAASFIFLRPYRALLSPKLLNFLPAALAVLLGTGLVSLYRALQMRRVALKCKILSLNVDPKNSIKDASSSFVAFGSVLLTTIGFHEGADAICGMLVAFYILTVAYVALRESSLVLLDAFHDPELTKEIESVIHMNRQVRSIKELKLRRAGPFIVGILEVAVDGDMTVRQMHTVVTELENSIKKRIAGLRNLTVKAIPTP